MSFFFKSNKIFLLSAERFEVENDNDKKFQSLFFSNKDNTINQYIDQYRTHQFDLEIKNDSYLIKFSKYGVNAIKLAFL